MAASASTEANRRLALRQEYEQISQPEAQAKDVEPDYEEPVESWLDARG
jgi:hypothetical protein